MKSVRFDTNVYYHLSNRDVVPQRMYNQLEQYKKDGSIVIYDNVISLFELLRKLIENKDNVIKAIKIAEMFCENNYLPHPELYLQNQLEDYHNKPKTIGDIDLPAIRKNTIIAYNKSNITALTQIMKNASELDKNALTFAEESRNISNNFQSILIDAFPELSNLQPFKINEENWDLIMGKIIKQPTFQKIILHRFLKLFLIPDELINITDYSAIEKLNTLNYFYRYYFMLFRQYIVYGRKPNQNDYEDLLQVIYLTATDYFVYHDKKFKTVLEHTFVNDPIIDKLVTLSELIDLLK